MCKTINDSGCASDMWNDFLRGFLSVSDKHAPTKNLCITKDKPQWMNNDILELMVQRDHLYCKAKKSKSETDWNIAKQARNPVNRAVMGAKRDYIVQSLNAEKKRPQKFVEKNKKIPTK